MKLMNMKLHESRKIEAIGQKDGRKIVFGKFIITRVPGGWIYSSIYSKGSFVFVPLNNEFEGKVWFMKQTFEIEFENVEIIPELLQALLNDYFRKLSCDIGYMCVKEIKENNLND